jgi:hypothetical protein
MMGTVNALFSYLLDYCLWPGSIFGSWQPFIATALASIFYKEDFAKILKEPTRQAQDESFIELMGVKKCLIYKLFGGCIICMNVWIGMASWFAIWYWSGGLFHPAYGFVYVLTGNAILRHLTGVVYK